MSDFQPLVLLCEPQAGRALNTACFVTVPPDARRPHPGIIGFRSRLSAAAWREAVRQPTLAYFPVRTEAAMERFAAAALIRLGHRYVAIGCQPVPAPEPLGGDEFDLYDWLLNRQPWSAHLLDFLGEHAWDRGFEALYGLE